MKNCDIITKLYILEKNEGKKKILY